MTPKKLLIEWKKYDNIVKSSFQSLYHDEDFTDVTLACEGDMSIKAHKVVLQAVSGFFNGILKLNPSSFPLIYLQGINYEDLISFKEFIYLGRTSVDEGSSQTFMKVAKSLMQNKETDKVKDNIGDNENKKPQEQNIKKENLNNLEETSTDIQSILNVNNFINEPLTSNTQLITLKVKSLKICKECLFTAKSQSKLQFHINRKHLKIKFPCETCGRLYSTLSKVNKCTHGANQSKKKETKTMFCDQCEYSTKDSFSLLSHNRKHTGEMILCDKCEYKCVSNKSLKSHNDSKHGTGGYKCKTCEFIGRTMKMLRFHKNSIHLGIRYDCKLCDYKATTRPNLQVHLRAVHQKIKFTCQYCNFEDSVESRVILHTKREHD